LKKAWQNPSKFKVDLAQPFLKVGLAQPFLKVGLAQPFLKVGLAQPFLKVGKGYKDILLLNTSKTKMSNQEEDNKITEQIFHKLEEFMFTRGNMAKYNKVFSTMIVEKIKEEKRNKQEEEQEQEQANVPMPIPQAIHVHVPKPQTLPVVVKKQETHFTPFQKDKLFWSFYIILKGFDEYELHHSDHFAIEKNFKIAAVEKMRDLKDELKEAKLKRNEIEDELVNKEMITLKGLHALCLVHKVSITYIYGRMYCEFLHTSACSGVIIKMGTNENSVKYDATEDYLTSIRNNYWKIENSHKPLGSSGAYTLKDLQDICTKLEIPLTNETGKNKLKTALYEDITKMVA